MRSNKNKSAIILLAIILATAALAALLVVGVGDNRHLSYVNIRQGLDLQGGVSILYQADIENPSTENMNAANDLLRRRLDDRGYTEATTVQEGVGQIRVDIPGVEDAEAAVAQIGASAMLTFTDAAGNVLLTGEHVARATSGVNTQGGSMEVIVSLEFTSAGTTLFANATRDNLGNPILIWMDDELLSSPNVNQVITDGTAQISGNFTNETANLLAAQIRQGALPFRLEVVSTNIVGARLGAGALETSVQAGAIGFGLVLLFLIIFYKTKGLAAGLALVIYVVLFMIILSVLGLTLSLPGIAGLILSIGMATDANIVVFERIREEVAGGKLLASATRTGYRRAWPAIIDSNVTTLLAGIVLWQLGTGPIIGFAQMLIIGILLSMFTSLIVTRIITTCFMSLGLIKSRHVISREQYEAIEVAGGKEPESTFVEKSFVEKRNGYFAFSAVVIALAIGVGIFQTANGNGFFNLDVEFSGGTSFTIDIGQPFDNSEIEEIVRNITGESAPQVQAIGGTYEVMIRTTEVAEGGTAALVEAMSERFNLTADDFTYAAISAAVSAAMRRSAMIAIAVSSALMLLYISIRFRDVKKGAAAVVAQLHDATVVLGVYTILRIPLNYAFIAVMLTTLGYSINATIIIFDRIRENRVRMPNVSTEKLINVSVTQTLRRTIFSTASSFIAVLMLYVIGVAAIRDFTLPIMVGLLFGAYSSVCLSGSIWYMFSKKDDSSN